MPIDSDFFAAHRIYGGTRDGLAVHEPAEGFDIDLSISSVSGSGIWRFAETSYNVAMLIETPVHSILCHIGRTREMCDETQR